LKKAEKQVPRFPMARGPGQPAWNHEALISPKVGRGSDPPPPPAETSRDHRGQPETQPMLPARAALPPGPTSAITPFFQITKQTQKKIVSHLKNSAFSAVKNYRDSLCRRKR
jgi:hypothetical protein